VKLCERNEALVDGIHALRAADRWEVVFWELSMMVHDQRSGVVRGGVDRIRKPVLPGHDVRTATEDGDGEDMLSASS